MGMRERLRKAILKVAMTPDKNLDALPVLERSLAPVLALASTIYEFGVSVRRLLYHFHILREIRLPIPVISVGNLTWGGTGKTPMVEYLARHFLAAQLCPLILTRGYRGGDEVRLLQKHLEGTSTKFGVGPNRAKLALSILHKQAGERCNTPFTFYSQHTQNNLQGTCDQIRIAILDDGMQHWALARDLEIVMVNAISLWGNERLVPRGPLRESLNALKRAHVVVLHHAGLVPECQLEELKLSLDSNLMKCSIVICSHMRPLCFYKISRSRSGESDSLLEVPLKEVQDAVVLCVSAIGCPESLALSLMQAGAAHVKRLDFSDHSSFKPKEQGRCYVKDLKQIGESLEELQQQYPRQKGLLVISEKDYMRDSIVISKLAEVADIYVLHSCLEISGRHKNEQAFAKLLESLCAHKSRGHQFAHRTSSFE